MNDEVVKSVLSEVLEEQKDTTINTGLLVKSVEDLYERIVRIEKSISSKIPNTSLDLAPLNNTLSRHVEELKKVIQKQPKEVINEKRILLFPETYKHEFYRIVVGKTLMWLVILATCLTLILQIKNTVSRTQKNYQRSWEDLYQNRNAKVKVMLDSIWESNINK